MAERLANEILDALSAAGRRLEAQGRHLPHGAGQQGLRPLPLVASSAALTRPRPRSRPRRASRALLPRSAPPRDGAASPAAVRSSRRARRRAASRCGRSRRGGRSARSWSGRQRRQRDPGDRQASAPTSSSQKPAWGTASASMNDSPAAALVVSVPCALATGQVADQEDQQRHAAGGGDRDRGRLRAGEDGDRERDDREHGEHHQRVAVPVGAALRRRAPRRPAG